MADPICRWRNPYVNTVLELIEILPNEELNQAKAREIVIKRSPYDFYRTPYQLACQLGLYHETDGIYFPKFTYVPSKFEVQEYLSNWIIHYTVPNPYTKSLPKLKPFSIHAELCRRLENQNAPIKWSTVSTELFTQAIGNTDILINSINTYSPVISITAGQLHLKPEAKYSDLGQYVDVDISLDRNNKEYFFDLFVIPSQKDQLELLKSTDLVTGITKSELDVINSVQNVKSLTQTEKNQIVAARIGQGLFRRNLIYECNYCPITGVNDSRMLIASHIKPWKISSNQERLDVKNGLLFTPTYDKLFDNGFISFKDNKEILISSLIDNDNRARLQLKDNAIYTNLPMTGRESFMNYHRDNIFKS